jgi:hypothetical protein
MMNGLMIVIMAVMSWTVTSKNTVQGSGEIPAGATTSYTCTYQKGTVRAGDRAVLTLNGIEKEKIQRIDVRMKCNKSSGAGVFTVQADGKTIVTKSGNFMEWTGAYDHINYIPVTLFSGGAYQGEKWDIYLEGTENSLYIDSYDIYYEPSPAYTVRLMCGGTIFEERTETRGGAGVILPLLPDRDEWQFAGWAQGEFWHVSEPPEMLYGGTLFYPETDITLWAAYVYREKPDDGYVEELVDGEYLYVSDVGSESKALAGVPENGEMAYGPIDPNNTDLYYRMTFTPSRDTVYITHSKTNTPIGYNSQAKMTATQSPWRVHHNGVQTVIYTMIGGKNYALWLSIYDKTQTYVYAGLLRSDNIFNAPMRLRRPAGNEETVYTCHPESGVGIEETPCGFPSRREKVLRNGVLYLIYEGRMYDLRGRILEN